MPAYRNTHANRSTGTKHTVPCPTCNRPTRHTVVAAWGVDCGNEDVQGQSDYEVVECDGCQTVSFRVCESDSDSVYGPDEHGNYFTEESIRLFPPRLVGHRPLLDTHALPPQVKLSYKEVLEAAASGLFMLSAIGLRAIVEGVCVEEGASAWGLEAKVNRLVAAGRLTTTDAALLEPIRQLGNDAAHEAIPPSQGDVLNALVVVEHLLQTVYLMKHKAEQLGDSVETRRRRARRSKGEE
jgi:Domain of unknown function (DUF4145)